MARRKKERKTGGWEDDRGWEEGEVRLVEGKTERSGSFLTASGSHLFKESGSESGSESDNIFVGPNFWSLIINSFIDTAQFVQLFYKLFVRILSHGNCKHIKLFFKSVYLQSRIRSILFGSSKISGAALLVRTSKADIQEIKNRYLLNIKPGKTLE